MRHTLELKTLQNRGLAIVVVLLLMYVGFKGYEILRYSHLANTELAELISKDGVRIDGSEIISDGGIQLRVRTEFSKSADLSTGASILVPAQVLEQKKVNEVEWRVNRGDSASGCMYLVIVDTTPKCLTSDGAAITLIDALSEKASAAFVLSHDAPYGITKLMRVGSTTYVVWVDTRLQWNNFIANLFMRDGRSGPLLVMARDLHSDTPDTEEYVLMYNADYLP